MERARNGIKQKYCCKCETWKSLSDEFYYNRKITGEKFFVSPCKQCRRDQTQARRAANPEQTAMANIASMRKWRLKYGQKNINRDERVRKSRKLLQNELKNWNPLIFPPTTYGDCKDHFEPCPWVRCHHHLLWDCYKLLKSKGNIEIVRILFSMPVTCSLDYTKQDHTLEEIAQVFNMTRERVRQIEEKALRKINRVKRRRDQLSDFQDFENDRKTDNSIYNLS